MWMWAVVECIPVGWLSGKTYSPFILSWLLPKQQRDWFIGCLQLNVSTWGTWKLLLTFAHVHIKVPKMWLLIFWCQKYQPRRCGHWMEFVWWWELRQVVIALGAVLFQATFMPPFVVVQTPGTFLESCGWLCAWLPIYKRNFLFSMFYFGSTNTEQHLIFL